MPPRQRARRRRSIGLALLAVALLIGPVSQPARRWLRWGSFLRRFGTIEARPGTPERLAGVESRRWGADRHGAELAPALVLVHGVHPEGAAEPRMARLATLFADEGFVVHVPDLPSLAAFDPDPAVVDQLRGVFDAVRAEHGCFGVVGISVGGGLALRALEGEPATAVLTIGAHDDLAAVAAYHERTGGTRYARRVMEAVGDVPPETLAALSPRRPPIGPVYVLHGEGDPLVPASEAVRLCERMQCARVVRTPWLGHTEVDGESPVPVLALLDQVFAATRVPCRRLRQVDSAR